MEQPISVLQAGKMLGVSHEAVRKAIASGRLVKCVVQVKGKNKILPSLIAKEWLRNTDQFQMVNEGGNRLAERVARGEVPAPGVEQEAPSAGAGAGPDLNQSKRIKAAYEARLAKLSFEEKSGKLVEVDGVRVEAFKIARTVRDSIMNIPERISAQLAAEVDPHKCYLMLSRELNEALEALTSNGA